MPGIRSRRIISDLVLIASGLIVLFLLPEISYFPKGCLFNKTTGLYCAGCGMSRGIHALLRGDLYRAAHFNLLLVTLVPLSGIWCMIRYYILRQSEEFKKYDKYVISAFIILTVLFIILRNVHGSSFAFLRPAW